MEYDCFDKRNLNYFHGVLVTRAAGGMGFIKLKKYNRYKLLLPQFFKNNRRSLGNLLPANSLAILNSNDVMPTNGDGVMKFVQQSDLYYLSGIDQEETVLALAVSADKKLREFLFVRETSSLLAIWEGEKLTIEEAREMSGIQNVYWLDEMPGMLRSLILESEQVYLNDNEHLRADNKVQTRDARFLKWCEKEFPLQQYRRLAPLLQTLRVIKQPAEIEMIKEAAKIGAYALVRVLQFTKPNVYEFEVEAEMTRALLQKRSRRHAFLPIIAAGASACILHYIDNNRPCRDGDLLLLDFGAEYGNYNCDISRTIPVNGRYTERQAQVYDAVKAIHDFACGLLKSGTDFSEYVNEVRDFTAHKVVELGLEDKQALETRESRRLLAHRYMPHGVSHFLGLDVHDVGGLSGKMKAGMVLTCEPGLYIKEEGLGIRLESDVLVTDGAPVNLTGDIPMDREAIENIMNR